jgi:hypothetical protein
MAVAGCNSGTGTSAASAPSATPSVGQPFSLYTHCGPDWRTSFDGSYWDLESPVTAPLGNPYQVGTMKLLGPQTARIDYELDGQAYSILFRRHDAGTPLKPPKGCD